MCGACGILRNESDWTEGFGSTSAQSSGADRLAERRRRIALVNELLSHSGLKLREQGRQLVLSSLTGKSTVVTSLSHVWREADRIGRQPPDPLDV